MRKRMTSAFVAVTFALLIGVTVRADDQQIGKQIVDRLQAQRQAAQLEGFNLGVQVESGTVTMSGSVSTEEQAALALDVARRVPGVKLVINDLRVEPAARETATATQPASFTATLPPVPPAAPVEITAPTDSAAPSLEPILNTALAAPLPAQPPTPMVAVPAPAQPVMVPTPRTMQPAALPATKQPLAFARGTLAARPAQANRGLVPAQYMEEHVGEMSSIPMQEYGGQYGGEVVYGDPGYATGMSGGAPVPMSPVGMGMPGGTPAYDNPQMPSYAWPSYASYPNYAALTYPHQYSPTAWPYIGPFYPYPQVPLGWRKVMLEWDDGWWYLDFLSK